MNRQRSTRYNNNQKPAGANQYQDTNKQRNFNNLQNVYSNQNYTESFVPEIKNDNVFQQTEIKPIPTVVQIVPPATNPIPEPANMDADSKISPFKKFFSTKRKGIRRKEKKARQNRRLRKLLTPKTALMALNELKGHLSQYKITGQGNQFTAEIHVNGIKYEGFGNSKIAAKNNASEKALRELIIQKMAKIPKKDVTVIPPTTKKPEEEVQEDVEMKDTLSTDEDDDVPMLHLASFALHKLFSEWEAQGYQIPDFRTTFTSQSDNEGPSVTPTPSEKKLPQPRAELPANAQDMHPSMLLAMMRPGVQYVEFGSEGNPPNIIHKMGVSIDGQEFIANGKTKKIARKEVAIMACNSLFNTKFAVGEPEK